MIDKEVIIFQIEDMLSNINKENLLLNGGHIDNGTAFLELMTNVLTLLKEQEAVEPIPPTDKSDLWRCGNCNRQLFRCIWQRYCPYCGREVKWDD